MQKFLTVTFFSLLTGVAMALMFQAPGPIAAVAWFWSAICTALLAINAFGE